MKTVFRALFRFFSHRIVYHALMWLAYVGLFLLLAGVGNGGFWFTLGNSLIHIVFLAVVIYFNLLYLIPRYLSEKRVLLYCFLLGMTAAVITPIKLFFLYVKVWGYPTYQQQIIDNQYFHFVLTFLLLIFSTLLKIVSDWARQQRVQQDLERQNLQSELKFLRAQINPHFLFNTLNSLYALTLKKSDDAPDLVLRLSEMMRYMLYECNERVVPLEKEINYIRNYIALESIRHGDKASITIALTGNPDGQYIAPMMFVPFLENSFKHGLSNQLNNGFVTIALHVGEHKVDFYIQNSTPTQHEATLYNSSSGIGLQNIKRRLEILYPNQYQLTLREQADTYCVHLIIQLNHD